jgi:N-methylhydantoinase A
VALGGIRADQADFAQLESQYRRMEQEALAELRGQGVERERISLVRSADLKVVGQTYELSLPLPGTGPVDERSVAALLDSFSRLYRDRYAFFFEGEPIEIVNLRVAALGHNPPVELEHPPGAGPDPAAARKGERPVYFENIGFVSSVIYERTRLRPGNVVKGPAIVEEETSSVLVPPDTDARVLDDLGLAIALNDLGVGGLA